MRLKSFIEEKERWERIALVLLNESFQVIFKSGFIGFFKCLSDRITLLNDDAGQFNTWNSRAEAEQMALEICKCYEQKSVK